MNGGIKMKYGLAFENYLRTKLMWQASSVYIDIIL